MQSDFLRFNMAATSAGPPMADVPIQAFQGMKGSRLLPLWFGFQSPEVLHDYKNLGL